MLSKRIESWDSVSSHGGDKVLVDRFRIPLKDALTV